jgi:hypothetical protein
MVAVPAPVAATVSHSAAGPPRIVNSSNHAQKAAAASPAWYTKNTLTAPGRYTRNSFTGGLSTSAPSLEPSTRAAAKISVRDAMTTHPRVSISPRWANRNHPYGLMHQAEVCAWFRFRERRETALAFRRPP